MASLKYSSVSIIFKPFYTKHLLHININIIPMTDSESENSACTWSLGNVRICGADAVAEFEYNMKNPDMSPERIAFFREAIEVWERCK